MEFEKEQIILDMNDTDRNIQLISNIIETTKELNFEPYAPLKFVIHFFLIIVYHFMPK